MNGGICGSKKRRRDMRKKGRKERRKEGKKEIIVGRFGQ
jgi:hypothetical protein